MISVF